MANVNEAQPSAAFISEPLTWKEICERYPDQWVCIADADWVNDTDFEFGTARVVGYGKTRKEPLDQARPWRTRYKGIGHFFTGRIRALFPRYFV
jgi:hypothetical protein